MLLTKEGVRRIEHLSPRKSLILEQKNSSSVRSRCPLYRVNCPIETASSVRPDCLQQRVNCPSGERRVRRIAHVPGRMLDPHAVKRDVATALAVVGAAADLRGIAADDVLGET